ncbi:UNVERIFIED_CONTAM: hypothetical protein GTU68_029994, partial [Idotea baltica]|nr:hypothetical protein [Idotea baltica]
TNACHILKDDLRRDFIRARGPGGRNVNRFSTAVQLRFQVTAMNASAGCQVAAQARLAGSRLTQGGEIILQADRFRTRERNREDALERLLELLRKAAERPKPRKATRPTLGSKKRRLESKKQRGQIKKMRGRTGRGED